MKPLKPQYSGKNSKGFWKRINAIKDDARHDTAYACGVALQEMEQALLRQINVTLTDCEKPTLLSKEEKRIAELEAMSCERMDNGVCELQARVKELERVIYERCELVDKCPDNPCCSHGCKMYEGCYPNTYRAQSGE